MFKLCTAPLLSVFSITLLFTINIFAQTAGAANRYSNEASCCIGIRGNVDGDPLDVIDISDLLFLVDYMFVPGSPDPVCLSESNVNGDENPSPDISDLLFLVDYMFLPPGDAPAPLECPSFITILNLTESDEYVYGTALVDDTSLYKVVLWAKTDRWYVQPSYAEPFTPIFISGLWSNATNPWDRIVALLVDTTYIPGSVREEHPSAANGVIDWDEYPEKSPDRYINWSGYLWRVKQGELSGPGPNAFSDDTANVWIDSQGRLHLKINYRDSSWYCSEIVLDQSFGYGTYSFKLDARVDSLDYNAIFAGFLYDTTAQEFDFEFSRRLANPFNAQYVVQPWYIPGNIVFYDLPETIQTSHSVEWRSDHITFTSWEGSADAPTAETIIASWTYTGGNIPTPLTERMRFNLYLFGGDPPVTGIGDEVIIRSFEYIE